MSPDKPVASRAPHPIESSVPRLPDGCPSDWAQMVARAQAEAHITLEGARVRYHCAEEISFSYDDPEEQVRAAVYSWLILRKGYSPNSIKIEVAVPRRVPNDFADLVVYTDSTCRIPHLVVETKSPSVSDAAFRQAVEQAFGYANSLRDTEMALVEAGNRSQLYAVAGHSHGERIQNRLGTRRALPPAYLSVSRMRLVAGDPNDDIQPRATSAIEHLVRRVHGLVWSGGKRDPFSAFDEWCKLLFAKIHDEQHTPTGQPRRFQTGHSESDAAVARRIRSLYSDARLEDPSIFRDDIFLPDDKIAQVVDAIQEVAFALTDTDTLGAAFERFFSSAFRGEFGQYFTRREICRFVCAFLEPTERDRILDPTCGSGGFLLEALMQVWQYIDDAFAGQPQCLQRKRDFTWNSLFGIEIHAILGRICQTNLMLHKDGHTNIEVGRSCLDTTFRNPVLDPAQPQFTLIVGNPPFGDRIAKGDRDQLGSNHLDAFEVAGGGTTLSSELAVIERAIRWLVPGKGRMGMVVPDGLLNNASEPSRCPAFRRFLFRNVQILGIVSLPDHAFRRSGAQNKTSLLFVRRWSEAERRRIAIGTDASQTRPSRARQGQEAGDDALAAALRENDYPVFLAEAERIGYSPTGVAIAENDLYQGSGFDVDDPLDTVLGQYRLFRSSPDTYEGSDRPVCVTLRASELFSRHPSHRIDAKYFTFKMGEAVARAQTGEDHRLGALLVRRREPVVPSDHPEREFRTITLTLEGELEPREAGKGRNPPGWHGSYFSIGKKWYVVRSGDILVSRIDLWKGCIGIVPTSFDGAIVTSEFPVYRVHPECRDIVDGRYLQVLLRGKHFRRALRAVTTGHSNRRRTQESDFFDLVVPLPPLSVQTRIAEHIGMMRAHRDQASANLRHWLAALDDLGGKAPTMQQLPCLGE